MSTQENVLPFKTTGLPETRLDAEDWRAYKSRASLFQKIAYPPRLSINGLLFAVLCSMLLLFLNLLVVTIPSPLNLLEETIPLQMMEYTFLLPVALFVGALLGPWMGTLAVIMFVGAGLAGIPVFTHGGGWQYIFQPGCGYLFGMIVAALMVGRSFHRLFPRTKKTFSRSINLILLAMASVLLVHIVGIVYAGVLTLLGQASWLTFQAVLLRLTAEPLLYDMAATGVFLSMVRQIRAFLWMVLY